MKNKILFALFVAVALLVTVYAASADIPGPDPVPTNISPPNLFDITSTPVTTGVVGNQYAYQVELHLYVNTTQLSYGLVSAPSGMSINSASGLVTWTPTQDGTYFVNLSVSGVAGTKSEVEYQAYNIVVTDNNPTPAGMLEITKVTVKVGGKRDTLTSPGTVDEEAELGDEIEIEVKVRNNFQVDNDDTIIRDIVLDVSSDLDEADGLDDEISKLRAGDSDELVVSFTMNADTVVPGDAPFDIDLEVEGETDDGTSYSDFWTITIDMDVKSRDLHIVDVQVSPTSMKNCAENRVRVNVEVRNIGSRDLMEGAVKLKISDLGLETQIQDIELDTGDDDTYTGYITIPANVAPGTYSLDVLAYPVRGTIGITDTELIDLTVLSCVQQEEDDDTGDDDEGNGGTIIIPDITVSGTPVSTAVGRRGLFDSSSPLYFILLGLLILLLLIIIILLIVRMATRN